MRRSYDTARRYAQQFKKQMKEGNGTLLLQNGDIFIPEKDEVFKQAYVTKNEMKSTRFGKARNQLPKGWFVSNYGRVLSYESRGRSNRVADRPNLLKLPENSAVGRPSYRISQNRTIVYYNLYGIVFGASATPKAYKELSEKGLDALGKHNIEGHHRPAYIDSNDLFSRKMNCQNLKFTTAIMNEKIIERIPANDDFLETASYLEECYYLMQNEGIIGFVIHEKAEKKYIDPVSIFEIMNFELKGKYGQVVKAVYEVDGQRIEKDVLLDFRDGGIYPVEYN